MAGRGLVAAGIAVAAVSLLILAFGRGMNPDHAVLALLFVMPLSVVVISVDSHGARKRL